MGHGRTGMVLAIYLIMFEGADATGAIQKVRSLRYYITYDYTKIITQRKVNKQAYKHVMWLLF